MSDTPIPITLGLQTDKRPGEYAELAVLAEELGFAGVSVFSDLMYQSSIVPLVEMAQATSRIRLGCACWNPFTLHPYEIANQAALLDDYSDGRAYVGLARGAWLDKVGVEPQKPVAQLREAALFIDALLRADPAGFAGKWYRLAPGAHLSSTTRGLPILIGTWGPRGAEIAGALADEIKIGGSANPDMVEVTRSRLQAGAASAGRGADDIGIVLGAVTVIDRDRDVARALARNEVAMYLDVVAELDPTVSLPPDLLPALRARLRGRHPDPGAIIPDAVLERFAFSGDVSDITAQAQRLIDAGVDRIEFGTPHGVDEAEGIRLLGAVLSGLHPATGVTRAVTCGGASR